MGWQAAANLMTAARLIALPFLIDSITGRRFGEALAICLAAGLTDTADGIFARRSPVPSRFGAYFDPIADKIFLGAVFLLFGQMHLVGWWLVAIIFGRDLLILLSAAVLLAATRHRDFPPSALGKFSTVLQISLAFFVLLDQVLGANETAALVDALIYAVAAVTAASGFHYALLMSRRLGSSVLPIDAPVPRE